MLKEEELARLKYLQQAAADGRKGKIKTRFSDATVLWLANTATNLNDRLKAAADEHTAYVEKCERKHCGIICLKDVIDTSIP